MSPTYRTASTDHLVDIDDTGGLPRRELEARAKALRTINAITDALLAATSPDDVIVHAIDEIAGYTRFPAIALYELNEAAGRLDRLHARGFLRADVAGLQLPLEGSLTGLAVRQREMQLSPHVSQDPRIEPAVREALVEQGFSAGVSVPLVVGERAIGALNLVYKGEVGLSDWEREMLESIAKAIAMAIDRAHQFESIERERKRACALALANEHLYREAHDALAMRDEFLSVAAHELRTPLTALQLDLASLARAHGARGDDATAGKLKRALQQAERLGKLSDGLVDVARLSMGLIVLQYVDLDLRELVTTMLDRHRAQAERAGCVIALGAGQPLPGRWDRARIEQALSNLLSNAIKYGAGHPIEIDVDNWEATARVTVTDHGIGIAAHDAKRIFERFERAAPSRHYGGLGLGLYVAREIVQAHGGSILVASEPRAGATFTVLLPVQPSNHEDAQR
jgi:signal transduction histidine kinase